jgi:tripartite-type tricarboxylate transporter receptor subunit TctC
MKLPHRRRFLHLAAGAAALPALSRIARAQAYPARSVRIIVPVAAGGLNDVTARLIGQWLSEHLGQQFFIENRPGAGTNLGTEAAVRASADGYTLLIASSGAAINATLFETLNSILSVTPRRSRASSACPRSCAGDPVAEASRSKSGGTLRRAHGIARRERLETPREGPAQGR